MKLILINKDNPIPENYCPNLMDIGGGYSLEKNAALSMKAMICAAAAEGICLRVFSAYRSIAYQKGLFDESTDKYMFRGMSYEKAAELTAQSIAVPGYSEHNAGLAADISSMDWQGDISEEFENTPEFAWLQKNAHRFGYILRYPKGKEHITGIIYEPWHYRYVGAKHAGCINRLGLTLEEYMQMHRACSC